MLDYIKRTVLLLGVTAILAQPAFAASRTDISKLVKKLEIQGQCQQVDVSGLRGRDCSIELENVTLEGEFYDRVYVNHFRGEDGSRQISANMFRWLQEGVFVHAIYDGGKDGDELDGKPDTVLKKYFSFNELLRLIKDGLSGSLKKYQDQLTPPDEQSRRLYDKVVTKVL